MGFGYRELLVIFLIALLIFGGKKIPEIARGLGRGLREFNKAKDDLRDAIENDDGEEKLAAKPPEATGDETGSKPPEQTS